MEEPVLDKLPSLCHTPKDSGPAPAQGTSSGKQQMSAALRERLRKTRRSFNASFTMAKRLKVDTDEKDSAGADTGCLPETGTDCSRLQDGSENLEGNGTRHTCFTSPSQESDPCGSAENSDVLQVHLGQQQSLEEKVKLVKQVQEKEELLRRLRMVKMYRSKNNLSELQALIGKWRSSTQLMLYELQSAFSADGKKVLCPVSLIRESFVRQLKRKKIQDHTEPFNHWLVQKDEGCLLKGPWHIWNDAAFRAVSAESQKAL